MGALEAHQGYRGENKREKPGSDLQIALEVWIGLNRDLAQPIRGHENKQKAAHVQHQPLKLAVIEI